LKLGTSLRFVFPTSPKTHGIFQEMLRTAPKGSFVERPLGAYETEAQAQNLVEVANAARAAGLDGLLVGDSHAASPSYTNVFQPIPTLARLMTVTGDMPVGVVVLAPFYHPVLLAEQIGTLAAFTKGRFIITFALGARPRQFRAFGIDERSRVGRLEEIVPLVRRLLMGEMVSFKGGYYTFEDGQISPAPRQSVSIWLAGTVAQRRNELGGWAMDGSPHRMPAVSSSSSNSMCTRRPLSALADRRCPSYAGTSMSVSRTRRQRQQRNPFCAKVTAGPGVKTC